MTPKLGPIPDDVRTAILPAHIHDTVRAIARLHAEHRDEATPSQRIVEGLTARAGQPGFIVLLTVLMVGWVGLNAIMASLGIKTWDEPPFAWLQGITGVAALYIAVLILATQRREDQLAGYREQLTLELGILSEQKAAKIIELLEELRRDIPNVENRIDREAEALSSPADPEAVLNAIKDTHDEMPVNDGGFPSSGSANATCVVEGPRDEEVDTEYGNRVPTTR